MSAPGVPFPLVANPINLSMAGSNLPPGPAARLGEHSEAVLSELGLSRTTRSGGCMPRV